MKLVGFNFNKINAERLAEDKPSNLTISNNIEILDVSKPKIEVSMGKEDILNIKFLYKIDYNPGYAKIHFSGEVFLSTDKKLSEDILKDWKNKKLSEDFKISLFNTIFRKSNIKALELEDQIGLPLHIPLPTISKNKKE
jgi:hypothetical protein